ncbi:MAG: hypothetical protein J5J00_08740 [Deltaproteobacteria bacterium]|nr:hypothetical protein [Deltaproteobacteria bacterium]
MPLRGNARRQFILSQVYEDETGEKLFRDSVQGQRGNPFADWVYLAKKNEKRRSSAAPKAEKPSTFFAGLTRDLNDPTIAKVQITDKRLGRSLLDNRQLGREMRDVLQFCLERRADTLIIGLPESGMPTLLARRIEEFQASNVTVLCYQNGQNGTPAGWILPSYSDAAAIARKALLPGFSAGFFKAYTRAGIYGDTIFVEPAPELLAPAVPQRAQQAFQKELGEMVSKLTEPQVLFLTASIRPSDEILRSAVYGVENRGGRAVILLPKGTADKAPPLLTSNCRDSLPLAKAALDTKSGSAALPMPSLGWGIFNRPVFVEESAAFHIDGLQDPSYPKYLNDLEVFFKGDLASLRTAGKGRIVLHLGDTPCTESFVNGLHEFLAAPLEKAGGLLVVHSKDPQFAMHNSAMNPPILQADSEGNITALLHRHFPIAPARYGKWITMTRPQRVEKGSAAATSSLEQKFVEAVARAPNILRYCSPEMKAVRKSEARALMLELPGDGVPGTLSNFLRNTQNEFRSAKKELFIIAPSARLRLTLRTSAGPQLPLLHKNLAEADLEYQDRLSPPENGWELFRLDRLMGYGNVLRIRLADPSLGCDVLFGHQHHDKAVFFTELRALKLAVHDYAVFVFPRSLEDDEIQNTSFIRWAVEELFRSGKTVIGIHPNRDLLYDLGFNPQCSFERVLDAAKHYKGKWR